MALSLINLVQAKPNQSYDVKGELTDFKGEVTDLKGETAGFSRSKHSTDKVQKEKSTFWQHHYVRVSVGVSIDTFGANQEVRFSDGSVDSFAPDAATKTIPTYGMAIGLYHTFTQRLKLLYGLGFYRDITSKDTGLVSVNSVLPVNYSYDIETKRLLVDTRLRYQISKRMASFGEIGLGYGWVKADNYQDDSNRSGYTFIGNTTKGLAYQMGVGFDYSLHMNSPWHFEFGLGYAGIPRKANLGSSHNRLNINNLDTGNIDGVRFWLGLTYMNS